MSDQSDVIQSGLVLFYLSRGHHASEAAEYAGRHLNGDSRFTANEPPAEVPQAALDLAKQLESKRS